MLIYAQTPIQWITSDGAWNWPLTSM